MAHWLIIFCAVHLASSFQCDPALNDTLKARRALHRCERFLAAQCHGQNRLVEIPGTCPQPNVGMPPPATSLFPGTEATELGCITRSSRLGRALWCLARATKSALELFTGIGAGSSLLLAHALTAEKPTLGRFYTVDRELGNAVHAQEVMRVFGLPAQVLRLQGPQGLDELTASVVQKPGNWILQGDVFKHPELIQALCYVTGGMDLIMLDPPTVDFRHTWSVMERACRPKFLVVHNTNLPGHAGWLPSFLKRQGGWYEMMNGSHPSVWETGVRSWSLTGRCW
ncbi:unnamed protein product [Effrenium voratum]|uniref:S-adenosyl-L-methionine-dependent methyltransferase n=1 Tax=Effrenium voratum TaxID=2562239 RepID=A0AA36JJ50_9DINO|nr:unnamed protein product [Effrenium voratum]CAJ1430360.1 unnamed protein product [Effrenium voratum]